MWSVAILVVLAEAGGSQDGRLLLRGGIAKTYTEGDEKLPGAYRGEAVGEPVDEEHECRHGKFSAKNQTCLCDEGWATAGITDTVDFIKGVCEQYQCRSDAVCQEVLGIPFAQCPVPNWNCYCGWGYAMMNLGTGYDTPGGKCMGLMYTFSIWATETVEYFMEHAWKVVLRFAILLLPFGRKRAICDHHRPSLWLGLSRLIGLGPTCRGECVLSATYTHDTFRDDLAWTLYVLDIGFWLYVFMFTLWVVTVSIWSILLWMAVILIIVCSLLMAVLALCAQGLGDCAGCECSGGGCAGCEALGAGGLDCGDCCGLCMMHQAAGGGVGASADAFYWSGTFPYDPWWGYSGYGYADMDGSGGSCCGQWCVLFCRPIAWLLYVFPAMPENMWGGFCGYFLFGTHQHTPPEHLYRGGSPIIEFLGMSWRRNADLHDDQSWRLQVYNFLIGDGDEVGAQARTSSPARQEALAAASAAGAFPNRAQPQRHSSPTDLDEGQALVMEDGAEVVAVGRAHAVIIRSPFDKDVHRCVKSSFEDYQKNACWICMGSGEEWDLWLSCRHLFCKICSTEMLRRRMPCPLCRVSSSTVLRGHKAAVLEPPAGLPAPDAIDMDELPAPGLPGAGVNVTDMTERDSSPALYTQARQVAAVAVASNAAEAAAAAADAAAARRAEEEAAARRRAQREEEEREERARAAEEAAQREAAEEAERQRAERAQQQQAAEQAERQRAAEQAAHLNMLSGGDEAGQKTTIEEDISPGFDISPPGYVPRTESLVRDEEEAMQQSDAMVMQLRALAGVDSGSLSSSVLSMSSRENVFKAVAEEAVLEQPLTVEQQPVEQPPTAEQPQVEGAALEQSPESSRQLTGRLGMSYAAGRLTLAVQQPPAVEQLLAEQLQIDEPAVEQSPAEQLQAEQPPAVQPKPQQQPDNSSGRLSMSYEAGHLTLRYTGEAATTPEAGTTLACKRLCLLLEQAATSGRLAEALDEGMPRKSISKALTPETARPLHAMPLSTFYGPAFASFKIAPGFVFR